MVASEEVASKTGVHLNRKFSFNNMGIMQFEDSKNFEEYFNYSFQNYK